MEEEQQHFDMEEPLSPLALSLSSPPLSFSKTSSTEVANNGTNCDNTNLQSLSHDLQNLIPPNADDIFSDVLFYVSGHAMPLHRCILAVRCPFFKSLFAKKTTYLASLAPADERGNKDRWKLKIDLGKLFNIWPVAGKVNYEAFMTIVEFLYTGTQVVPTVNCMDDDCLHEACRPVVDFAIDMLGLTSVLDITNLKNFWQNHLHNILEKAHVDEVLPVLMTAKLLGEDSLVSRSLHLVASSNLDSFDVEKLLPNALANEVLALRCNIDLLKPEDLTHEKECQKIRKALESDDIELLHLLLKEGSVDLNQAYALHYAISYCDPHTVKDIMDLGLADVNFRNNRGFTALHVASMRQDPSILVTILSKGANPVDSTPDGRTARQLCSRLIRKTKNRFNSRAGNLENNRLCMEILYQAETKGLFDVASAIFPPTLDEKELFMRLVYLENRIALARLLFPQETKLVTDICHLESTSEFIGYGFSDLSKMSKKDVEVDLNQIPSIPVMNEALLKRMDTLQKSVTLGRRIFPYTFTVINSFTDDDDPFERSIMQTGSSEEQNRKKRRYHELKQALENAFLKDIAALERYNNTDKEQLHPQHEE